MAAIEPALIDMNYEIVRIVVLGKLSPTIQIMVDRADGSLIKVEDCEQVSRAVSAILDVNDPIEGAWTLEVSSAGIDRPLARSKDWKRFAGHIAKVEMMIPIQGRRRFSGVILDANEQEAQVRLEDGLELTLPFNEVRKAKLVLTDALIAECNQEVPVDSISEDTKDTANKKK